MNLYKYLTSDKKKFIVSKQLLRSGSSNGANVQESIGGQSEKNFLSKISIAYKEVRQTKYWLKLLQAIDYLTEYHSQSLLFDAEKIGKIQTTIKSRN